MNTSWDRDWNGGEVVFDHFFKGSLQILCCIKDPLIYWRNLQCQAHYRLCNCPIQVVDHPKTLPNNDTYLP